MANQHKNKVIYNGNTLIDLTGDTVTAADVAQGKTFHLPSGQQATGTMIGGAVVIEDTTDSHGGTIREITATDVVHLQGTKSVTPSESAQTVTPDTGYDALSSVSVGAISSTYVGSGISRKSSSDLTASGATVTVPAGYYSSQATKSVSSMTLPTSASSSATSGYTSKATINRSTSNQYINIPTGYNSSGAYYTVSATPNGTATSPTSISGTSATVSTGTNTITLTKSVSVTPRITTAGYISSGTAGNSSVSLTASVTTQGAKTVTPSTSQQTAVSSGTYVTGNVTVSAMPTITLPTSATSTSTGTKKATITPAISSQYLNIPTGYNSSAQYYEISPIDVGTKTITENGTYYSYMDGYSGFSSVTVDVSGGEGFPSEPFNDNKNHYIFLITDSNDATIEMRFTSSSGTIDWGDGTTSSAPSSTSSVSHTYSSVGMYDVKYGGSVPVWQNTAYVSQSTRGKLLYAESYGGLSGTGSFNGAYGLKYAYVFSMTDAYTSYAFGNCYCLTSCHVPNSLTTIGTDMFRNCYSLGVFTIPSGVTSIGNYAFQYCRSLKSITIPSGVTSIGNYAFQYCSEITEYHVLPTTPPTIGTSCFQTTATGCKIYVPSSALASYQTAWSTYASYLVGE